LLTILLLFVRIYRNQLIWITTILQRVKTEERC